MYRNKKLLIRLMLVVFTIGITVCSYHLRAMEMGEDGGISLFSLGDDGETILVCGREETVGDFGDVIGYEITSHLGTGYIEYRDNLHHSMTVTTSDGSLTEGYCMQAYMTGPSLTAYQDYNYIEGSSNSTIFSSLSNDEIKRWQTVYVVATKYGFGGTKADPNYVTGTNEDDGGTFGTYIINRDGRLKVVRGLMVGGRVYEMNKGEARALTQVIVHYVGNRGSEHNITDFVGYEFPEGTSAAFKHLKAYADNAGLVYDQQGDIDAVSRIFDNYEHTVARQSISWYVYDCAEGAWVPYEGSDLDKNYINQHGDIELKIVYDSKNMCNKLLVNSDTDNTSVVHNYEPYLVYWTDTEENYYDYFTVINSSDVPVEVTYEKVSAGQETINHELLGGMEYCVDIFSQEAYVKLNAQELMDNGGNILLSVETGEGATAGDCYDVEADKYGSRMYSCRDVQDCLFLASNKDISTASDISVSMNVSGKLELKKVSGKKDITDNNSCYSFAGATYNVYSVESDKDVSKDELAGTFTVVDSGQGLVTYSRYNTGDVSVDCSDASKKQLTNLPLGWYMVCEETPPTNGSYKLDTEKYYVYVGLNDYDEVKLVVSEEQPVADPIPFEVVKQCVEGDNVGSSSLEGAEFTVWYYKGEYNSIEEIEAAGATYDRRWFFKTAVSESTNNSTFIIHKDLLLEGSDEPYISEKGNMVLPLGTIVVEETKAPVGYRLDGATYNIVDVLDGTKTPIAGPYVSVVEAEQGTVKLRVSNTIIVDEEPIRGDLKLVKKDKYTEKPMAGVAFSITSDTTGESHIIVTDENGVASTASSAVNHSQNTNGNDDYDENDALKPTGVWFVGNMNTGDVYDEKGALPFDTYTVNELPCAANKDYYIGQTFKVTITENGAELDYGALDNVHKPEIGTEAFDGTDMDKTLAIGDLVYVKDIVSYNYLDTEKSYVLKGVIMNKTTGEVYTQDGKPVESYVEFTPEKYMGEIEVPFEFMLACCKGDKLVVYEYLYEKESGELVASHQDINCEKQTLLLESRGVENAVKEPEKEIVIEEDTSLPEIPETPKTGDGVNVPMILGMMAISMLGIIIFFVKYKKKTR